MCILWPKYEYYIISQDPYNAQNNNIKTWIIIYGRNEHGPTLPILKNL